MRLFRGLTEARECRNMQLMRVESRGALFVGTWGRTTGVLDLAAGNLSSIRCGQASALDPGTSWFESGLEQTLGREIQEDPRCAKSS